MPELPTGTVTFLFTDVEDSTRLWEQHPRAMRPALARHDQLIESLTQAHAGFLVRPRGEGDSRFAVFRRALDALSAAVAIQLALQAEPWHAPIALQVRMGLHTGEGEFRDGDYYGTAVNRAARLRSLAYGGQILVSQTTRGLVHDELPEGLSLLDLGEHALKGLERPEHIYQLLSPGLAAEYPPLQPADAVEEPPAPGAAPFKGLHYFDEADAGLFFGRELLVARIVGRLREALASSPSSGVGRGGGRFLALIVGASGSGKSSLVRAGVIPALKRGEALADGTLPPEGCERWRVHLFTPGPHPLESLALSLTREAESVTAAATLADDLTRDERALHLYVRRLMSPEEAGNRLLLVVDQFEELFTLARDEAEQRAFVDNLLYAAGSPTPERPARSGEGAGGGGGPTVVIITLRADFYAHCARFPNLREALSRHQEYIGAMTQEELRRAIEEPAREGEWSFEPGLVDLLLQDVGDEPGALPLLSHALLETWKRRRGRMLTFTGYAESGGIRGAIAKTAQRVYQRLAPEEQGIARGIFLRLTELGEGTQDTRRRAARSELIPRPEEARDVEAVLQVLAEARLITLGEEAVEVAHEALIREWPTLREWLNEDREGLRLHRHLTEAAQEWDRRNRDPGEVYRGARLAQALEWSRPNADGLNALEREFLEASRETAHREEAEREDQRERELASARRLAETERRAAKRLRRRAVFLTGALVVAGLLAVAAAVFGQRASENERQAAANARSAQTAEAQAIAQGGTAIAERNRADAERSAAMGAKATAEGERQRAEGEALRAEREARLATSRELAAAAISNLNVDADRSVLLALQAVSVTYSEDQTVTREAENALHRAVQALRGLYTLSGHAGLVAAVVFSPDGARLASASSDQTAKVWDAASGQELFTLAGHTELVTDIAFSPEGRLLATASGDGTARIWDAASGQALFTLFGHSQGVGYLVFSPDGSRLATGSLDRTAKVWDTASGRELVTLTGHTDRLFALAFSPDGSRLATASKDGTARIWDPASGNELLTLSGHTGRISHLDFSPDGARLATASVDNTAKIWDAATGELALTLSGHAGPLEDVVFSPDGTRVATAGQDTAVKLWEAASGRDLLTFSGHTGTVVDVAFSPDGTRLATASADGTAKVWDVSSGLELFTLAGHAGRISRLAFSPDGGRLATASQDGTARLWDASPRGGREWLTLSGEVGQPTRFERVAFSPSSSILAAGGLDGQARIWDSESGEQLFALAGHADGVVDVAFSPDELRLATTSRDGTTKVWDISPGGGSELLTLFGHTASVGSGAFSPDGTRLATASHDGTAIIWDATSGRALTSLTGHTGQVLGVAFSPDGTRLATAGQDGTAIIWDAASGQKLASLTGHDSGVHGVVFSPDGTRLATASQDATAKVWDASSGQELLTLTGHTGGLRDIAFSAGGTRLATVSLDGTARVWDITSGQEVLTLTGHTGAVLGVAFSPDGRWLATASVDGTVRVYLLRIEELIALAQSRVGRSLSVEECERYLRQPRCPPD